MWRGRPFRGAFASDWIKRFSLSQLSLKISNCHYSKFISYFVKLWKISFSSKPHIHVILILTVSIKVLVVLSHDWLDPLGVNSQIPLDVSLQAKNVEDYPWKFYFGLNYFYGQLVGFSERGPRGNTKLGTCISMCKTAPLMVKSKRIIWVDIDKMVLLLTVSLLIAPPFWILHQCIF